MVAIVTDIAEGVAGRKERLVIKAVDQKENRRRKIKDRQKVHRIKENSL
jgi:hypothetical protein